MFLFSDGPPLAVIGAGVGQFDVQDMSFASVENAEVVMQPTRAGTKG